MVVAAQAVEPGASKSGMDAGRSVVSAARGPGNAGAKDVRLPRGPDTGPRPGLWIIPGFQRLWLAAVALPLAALVLAGFWAWSNVIRTETSQLERTVAILREQTLRTIETQDTVITALDTLVSDLSWPEIERDPRLVQFARRLVAASPSVNAISLVTPDGRVALTSRGSGPPPQFTVSDRDYVTAFPRGSRRSATFIGPPVTSRFDGNVEVHVSRPHIGVGGMSDGGVIVSAFSPAVLQRVFRDVAGTPATKVTLTRDDGSLLARYPGPVRGDGERLPPVAADSLRDDLAAHAGAVRITREGSLLAGMRLASAMRVGDAPLFLQIELDPAVVRDAWVHEMAFPSIGTAAAMTLLLMLTAKAQRRTFEERTELLTRTYSAEAGHAIAHERAELEARLRQTEKVAALGQLAAGVAHDFNNVLQAIISSAEALRSPATQSVEIPRIAELILGAGERGIELTRRMLDYARRDERPVRAGDRPLIEARTDAGAALRNAVELLGRTLSSLYTLRLSLPPGKLPATAGPQAELETVIINLVVNARDAMPGGGLITVAAAETMGLGETALASAPCVRVTVLDTGMGMDAATLNRAGEAFFTTKQRGEGTGLGLSMARGYAERVGGSLVLESRQGHGTIVTLWLPLA